MQVVFMVDNVEDQWLPQTSGVYGLYCVCAPCMLSTEKRGLIRYVGLASNLRNRFKTHLKAANKSVKKSTPVYSWIRAHGVENTRMFVLQLGDISSLNDLEIHWVSVCDTYLHESSSCGLNLTRGGNSTVGLRLSTEAKNAISARQRGKSHSDEWRENQRLGALSRPPVTEAARAKMRARWSTRRDVYWETRTCLVCNTEYETRKSSTRATCGSVCGPIFAGHNRRSRRLSRVAVRYCTICLATLRPDQRGKTCGASRCRNKQISLTKRDT